MPGLMRERVRVRGAPFGTAAALLIASLAGLVVGPSPGAPAESRPNILLAIADDWSWPHAGAYGDQTVATLTLDRIAREGVLFTHAFTMAPSCTPSRAAILTGQAVHRLEQGGNLHGFLSKKFPLECWPWDVDPTSADARQFEGWPYSLSFDEV